MATQEELNAWVEKQLQKEKDLVTIEQIKVAAEAERRVHSDAISYIDEKREADIQAILSK